MTFCATYCAIFVTAAKKNDHSEHEFQFNDSYQLRLIGRPTCLFANWKTNKQTNYPRVYKSAGSFEEQYFRKH